MLAHRTEKSRQDLNCGQEAAVCPLRVTLCESPTQHPLSPLQADRTPLFLGGAMSPAAPPASPAWRTGHGDAGWKPLRSLLGCLPLSHPSFFFFFSWYVGLRSGAEAAFLGLRIILGTAPEERGGRLLCQPSPMALGEFLNTAEGGVLSCSSWGH